VRSSWELVRKTYPGSLIVTGTKTRKKGVSQVVEFGEEFVCLLLEEVEEGGRRSRDLG
jgi:hypothetical protein